MEQEEGLILNKETLQLYKDYAGIASAKDLTAHLQHCQDSLLHKGKVTYRCIEHFKFAFSRIYYRFFYKDIIEFGKKLQHENQEPYFLDIGCCTGTDLRQLLLDGYPKSYLIGTDVDQAYIDCGYTLFRDSKETCPIQFIVGNIFSDAFLPTSSLSVVDTPLSIYKDKIAVVHAGSVFHLFDGEETSLAFLKRIVMLLKPNGMLVGGHVISDKNVVFYRPSTKSDKFLMGRDTFYNMLESQGFKDIKMEATPKQYEGRDYEQYGFKAFWLAFSAVYKP
ncbi:hypothetical protein K501DRAFT_249906 [Backusella circina FSU 941]|nr:hypothetical protein K501DRAFT_249906 [Backusella circina FSU 941]